MLQVPEDSGKICRNSTAGSSLFETPTPLQPSTFDVPYLSIVLLLQVPEDYEKICRNGPQLAAFRWVPK